MGPIYPALWRIARELAFLGAIAVPGPPQKMSGDFDDQPASEMGEECLRHVLALWRRRGRARRFSINSLTNPRTTWRNLRSTLSLTVSPAP